MQFKFLEFYFIGLLPFTWPRLCEFYFTEFVLKLGLAFWPLAFSLLNRYFLPLQTWNSCIGLPWLLPLCIGILFRFCGLSLLPVSASSGYPIDFVYALLYE